MTLHTLPVMWQVTGCANKYEDCSWMSTTDHQLGLIFTPALAQIYQLLLVCLTQQDVRLTCRKESPCSRSCLTESGCSSKSGLSSSCRVLSAAAAGCSSCWRNTLPLRPRRVGAVGCSLLSVEAPLLLEVGDLVLVGTSLADAEEGVTLAFRDPKEAASTPSATVAFANLVP